MFDPKQIFLSPSIKYCDTDVYAKQAMNTLFERLGQVRYSNNDYPKHLEPNNHPAARGEEES